MELGDAVPWDHWGEQEVCGAGVRSCRNVPAPPALEGRGQLGSAALIKHKLYQGRAGTDTFYHSNHGLSGLREMT